MVGWHHPTAPGRTAGAPPLWQLARSFPVTGPQPLSSLRERNTQLSLATRGEDGACQGQPRGRLEKSEVAQLCPTLSNPMDCSPPGSSVCPWDFPGKSIGVGCHCLLRPITYTHGAKIIGFPGPSQKCADPASPNHWPVCVQVPSSLLPVRR